MSEAQLRDEIARHGRSIFERGLTCGSSGNISVKLDDGWLMTPTGSNLGDLDPARISRLDENGKLLEGDAPTKESFLHMAMYENRPTASAILHVHSMHSVAVSCLADVDPRDVLPKLTAYYVMRVGTLPLVPYFAPGDRQLAKAVAEMASDHHAVLLSNHGPVVAGKSLTEALHATEELEETAKLFLALQGMRTRPLTSDQIADLNHRFPA